MVQDNDFKSKKSLSLSVRKGKIDAATTFAENNTQIPTISEEKVKSIGRWYVSSNRDTKGSQETAQFGTEELPAINRYLQGKFKLWCLLHFLLIRKLLCPLLINEISS